MIKSLSIIMPLFNEDKRLDNTFREIIKFIKKNKIYFKEFIFVNDGSSDKSGEMINNFIKKNKKYENIKFKLIKLKKNSGKGAALKAGVKNARGKWILTSDIDFSVSLFELERWLKKKFINNKNLIYFGSRAHINSKVDSKYYRKFIGSLLRFSINFILNIKIRDTQCGFKLYEKFTARKIFSQIKLLGYEHDIEIVLISKKFNFKIIELPVSWKHVNLSKVNIISDSIKFFCKIIFIKIKFEN